MKRFIFVLMTVAYSMLSSFLFWLFFKWITPYVMNASWIMLLLYPFLALGFICMIVSSYAGVLSFLNGFFMKDNMAYIYYYLFVMGIFFLRIAFPFEYGIWSLSMDISYHVNMYSFVYICIIYIGGLCKDR